jgi:hypothetical protein
MTRPGPPGSVTSEDGSRFYEVDGEQYWSVTTALKIMGSEGLIWWSAGLAAQAALDNLPKLAVATITKPCGNTYNKCRQGKGDNAHDWRQTCPTCPCTACKSCVYEWLRRQHTTVRDERADEGRRLHDWVEQWIVGGGGVHPPIHDDIAPYVRAFLVFVAHFGLTPDSWLFAEATVVCRAHKYAGTTDGAIRFEADATPAAADWVARALQIPLSQTPGRHADILLDVKTKLALPEDKTPRFFPDVALQMAPYRWAPIIRLKPTGEERPMPDLDGAMALYLYPDMAVPRLCVSDEGTLDAFLNALGLYRWNVECGSAAVSEKSFPLPPEPKAEPVATVRAPGTRAPRKATKAAVAKAEPAPAAAAEQPELVSTAVTAAKARAAAKSSATIASLLQPPPSSDPASSTFDGIPF